ncbi:MAG: beta-galactosidase [Clostridia bacterium]|nr:beta-galactosidase [Clostridia bacterium]
MKIEIKNRRYYIDGKEKYLVSGEFHYFRVPSDDFERRMRLFKEAGGNCISTYVPWCIHEETEGEIVFGDRPERDLAAFLEVCKKLDLPVTVRPGPYCYSELIGGGVPTWINEKYPEILACRQNGEKLDSASYMHPHFFEKAEKYLKAFAKVVKPYLSSQGGPVCMCQLDNELTGTQIWAGTLDYNPQTWGFGDENGRYAKYLRERYNTVENVNSAYNTSWSSFADALPLEKNSKDEYACRCSKDMFDFYLDMCGEYLEKTAECLRNEGIDVKFCHNAGNLNMTSYFEKILPRFEKYGGLMLGCDHYYNLGLNFEQNNPTPQYAVDMLCSYDQLLSLSMPQTVLELPGGSPSDFPPMLSNDLLACFFVNAAMGMKGLNYYIFTGGPNYKNTGGSSDIYDFNAFIRADGTLNETYTAAEKFGAFLEKHRSLQSAERNISVRVGYDGELFRSSQYGYESENSQAQAKSFMKKGVLYALLASSYSPGLFDIASCAPDTDMPLILCGADALCEKAQRNVVSFVEAGGKLIVFKTFPTLDDSYSPCTVLKDFADIKTEKFSTASPASAPFLKTRIHQINIKYAVVPKNGEEILLTAEKPVAIRKKAGKGEIVFCGFDFTLSQLSHVDMLSEILAMLGAKKTVCHSNPHIFTTVLENENGEKTVFLMNLYSSPQKTDICFEDKSFKDISLAAMEVKTIDL